MQAQPDMNPEDQPHMDRSYFERKVLFGLQHMGVLARKCSREHGFWEDFDEMVGMLSDPDRKAKYILDVKLSKMALVGSEVGEAVEGIRKPKQDEHCPEFTSEEVELADAIIRMVEYAEKFGLRLAEAAIAKMRYNESRPYKHGKGA